MLSKVTLSYSFNTISRSKRMQRWNRWIVGVFSFNVIHKEDKSHVSRPRKPSNQSKTHNPKKKNFKRFSTENFYPNNHNVSIVQSSTVWWSSMNVTSCTCIVMAGSADITPTYSLLNSVKPTKFQRRKMSEIHPFHHFLISNDLEILYQHEIQ